MDYADNARYETPEKYAETCTAIRAAIKTLEATLPQYTYTQEAVELPVPLTHEQANELGVIYVPAFPRFQTHCKRVQRENGWEDFEGYVSLGMAYRYAEEATTRALAMLKVKKVAQ